MIWTNPASSDPPASQVVTSEESVNVTSPAKHLAVSAHHAPCSGRSLLRRAASSDSNRTTVMNVPSSVKPAVEPSQPIAPGRQSRIHRSIAARKPSSSATLPWMTWTNISPPPHRCAPRITRGAPLEVAMSVDRVARSVVRAAAIAGTYPISRPKAPYRSQAEERPQADRETRPARDLADAEEHTGHERRTVERVVADRQRLAGRSEQNLLVGDEACGAHGMHMDALEDGPARSGQAVRRRIGHRVQSGLRPGRRHQLSGTNGRAARRICRLRMVQLDDLDGLVMQRGQLREPHRQHRADR